jgi:hypothetical protein
MINPTVLLLKVGGDTPTVLLTEWVVGGDTPTRLLVISYGDSNWKSRYSQL